MAALDPVAYVRATPPFDALPAPLFDDAARALEIGFWTAGDRLVSAGGEPLRHLYVIRRGSVRLERDGQTLQVLEDGETFGYTSLITRKATLDVLVEDDLLAYLLPDAQFQRLLADARFAGHFAVGLAARLKSSLEHSPVATFQADLSEPLARLVHRPAVWVDAGATVAEAARAMRAARISSVLVRTEPPGIVTDRDFRGRVLARGLGPATPVVEVFSRPLRTVGADTPVYQAWTSLLEAGVHHLPVVRDGEILGVLTSSDLLKCTSQGPIALLRRVERLATRDALGGYGSSVAEMASALLSGGLDATAIAGFVARLNDTLVRRILEWAEAELGPPPAPYAWIVFGSEGRREQTLLTDQDNALVFADEGLPGREWFAAVADRANTDLEAAGFPPCIGHHVARRWNGPLSEWIRRFRDIVDKPRPHDAAVFFDFRRVAGALDVSPLDHIASRAARNPLFLRFLAREAMEFSPPTSLGLRAPSTVDLKRHGITPVVYLARCYGLEAGARTGSTVERLEAAARAGIMGETVFATVTEAYRFLLGLRLRLQLRAISEGRPLTHQVAMSELTAIERSRLKDSLRAVKAWQEKAAYHYQTDFL
jgi:CBS domain-containing protein